MDPFDPKWVGVVMSLVGTIWWAATQFSSTKKDIETLQDGLKELKSDVVVIASVRVDIGRLQEQIKSLQSTLLRVQKDEK